ncbi:MAG TPA: hypothetical protein VE621_16365 [Bryobacteraceae bacterium]|jgi:uncharacterized protein (TIGR03437 family)|nr:hypothetical protein [Bryobacteraceae bacterium]
MKSSLFAIVLISCIAASAQTPAISPGGIVNGASFVQGEPIAAGSLITIFGTALASVVAQADTIPLATTLGNVSVNFVTPSGTIPAPLLFVQNDDPSKQITSQINLQVPWNAIPPGTTGTVNVVVTRGGVSSAPTPVTIGPYSPGVFTSGGRVIAINPDGTLAWPAGVVPGLTSHPARISDPLVVYATGLGAVDSTPANGQNSLDKLRRTVVTPIVLVGGMSAQVQFSGLSPQFVGVNQINVVVPNIGAGDAVPLQVQVGGITTPDRNTIAVMP